jgi:hypothetical protein
MKAAGVFLATKACDQVPAYVKDRGLQKVARDALAGKTNLKDVVAPDLGAKARQNRYARPGARFWKVFGRISELFGNAGVRRSPRDQLSSWPMAAAGPGDLAEGTPSRSARP